MCTGTAYWANIGRIVYGASEASPARAHTAITPRTPRSSLPCRELIARGQKAIEVIGPIPTLKPSCSRPTATSGRHSAPTLHRCAGRCRPGGTVSPWGGPAAKPCPHAPPLRGSLPPMGAFSPWGGPAAKPCPHAPPLRGSLPPRGTVSPWGGPAAKPCPHAPPLRGSLPPMGAFSPWVGPAAKPCPTLLRCAGRCPPWGFFRLGAARRRNPLTLPYTRHDALARPSLPRLPTTRCSHRPAAFA